MGDPSHDAVGSLQLQLSAAAGQLQGLATQLEKRLDGMRDACARGAVGFRDGKAHFLLSVEV